MPVQGPPGRSAREDVTALLAVLIERVLDKRASHILRAPNAEADAFPELHKRYFDEIVAPRRDATNQAVGRGIASGEIRPDVDPGILSEVLVSPVLARMASGNTDGASSRSCSLGPSRARPQPR